MTGSILIIIGILFLVAGVIIHFSNRSEKSENKLQPGTKGADKHDSQKELKEFIRLAAVDGVITDKEREVVLNKAFYLKIDLDKAKDILKQELEKTKTEAETRLIDKKKEAGNNFEAFVVSKFNPDFFSLKQWAGDKFVDGIYAETTIQPDLVYRFEIKGLKQDFAVECKYRSQYSQNGIEWALEYQFENYKSFQEKNQIPVFVAIGVGGKPDDPDELFIIPLKAIQNTFLSEDFLKKYKKRNFKEKGFYFNHDELTLN
jgi:hypothetical protein